jgi:hypothetical protein
MSYYIVCVLFYDSEKYYRTRITGSTGSAGYLKLEWWKESHETSVIKLHTVSGSESFFEAYPKSGQTYPSLWFVDSLAASVQMKYQSGEKKSCRKRQGQKSLSHEKKSVPGGLKYGTRTQLQRWPCSAPRGSSAGGPG